MLYALCNRDLEKVVKTVVLVMYTDDLRHTR
jgi:hypothetical protein